MKMKGLAPHVEGTRSIFQDRGICLGPQDNSKAIVYWSLAIIPDLLTQV